MLLVLVMAPCAIGCGHQDPSCEPPDVGSTSDGVVEICDRQDAPDAGLECVSEDEDCESGSQCPSGLTCAKLVSQDPCFAAELDQCRCRPIAFGRLATGPRRLTLQQGFAVGGMASAVDSATTPPRLTWQAPAGARYVACALFSCAPSFERSGCSPTDEAALYKIDNFDQCVLLFGAFPATQPGFLLSPENAFQGGASSCTASELGPRVVTELAAGCWAYDTTSIIAATELHPIRGSLLAELPGLPREGACQDDGAACYDASADVFGVCLEGACRPRCRSPADCALGDPTPAAGGTCGWACRPVPGQALGACVPAT